MVVAVQMAKSENEVAMSVIADNLTELDKEKLAELVCIALGYGRLGYEEIKQRLKGDRSFATEMEMPLRFLEFGQDLVLGLETDAHETVVAASDTHTEVSIGKLLAYYAFAPSFTQSVFLTCTMNKSAQEAFQYCKNIAKHLTNFGEL